MTVFVDSSAWYAASDSGDGNNSRAKDVLNRGEALATSDHVLLETWLLLHRRLGRAAAERFWERLRAGLAHVECVQPIDLEAAWGIGQRYPDQDFSLADRTSFAVMERQGLTKVASFDDDFAIYRFGRARDRAFTVLR